MLELILEGARRSSSDPRPGFTIEKSLGFCRFVEMQGGWVTAWGGDDEMPVELWLFSFDDIGESVYAWPANGDIEKGNWEWSAGRLNILPQEEEA